MRTALLARPTGLARLFARKPIACFERESEFHGGAEMRRSFGPVSLTMLGVGTIVGLGIYVVTGQIAANMTGPAIVLSFLIAGFACACAALCFAELGAMLPVAGGSAYAYTHLSIGELPAWIIAWSIIAEYLFATAAVGSGWSAYTQSALNSLNLSLPALLSSPPIETGPEGLALSGSLINLPATLLIAAAGAIVLAGTRTLARFNGVIVTLKISVVILIIVFGLAYAEPANWSPFVPPEQFIDGASRYGWQGVLTGAGMIFFAYLGFDTVSTAGRETREPQRTLPIAILGSIGISTVLYIGISFALTGLVPYRTLDHPAPVYAALAAAGSELTWLGPIVTISAIVGLASAALALSYGLSRIFFALAGDGLLPRAFTRLSARSRVPTLGVIVASGSSALLAGVFPIEILGELISSGTLIAFCVVCATLAYLRITRPELPRPFKVPAWPIVATVGFAVCLYLLINLGTSALLRIVAWMSVGVVIYLGYGLRSRHGWSSTTTPHR